VKETLEKTGSPVNGEQRVAGKGLDWTPEEMRRLGYAVVDAVVARHAGLAEGAPWRGGSRSELEALFRESCPEEPGDPDQALRWAVEEILPRAGRIDHPRFMAFVPSSPVWPAILGQWLTTGFNTFQGTWLESAGPSQIELVVVEWFREWMGLPEGAGGLFTSGGSAANLTAVVAARERAGNPDRPSLYISDQAHSSVARGIRIAGLPAAAVRRIPVGEDLRMRADLLSQTMEEDVAAGFTPVLVVGNGGATNTGLVDPLPELAALSRRYGAWFHVDAAYGGFAVLTPRGRDLLRGIEQADSITLDPHKWLFQPYEAGCLLVRETRELEAAFRVSAEYLQDTELGMEHVNFGDRGLQLTRSFRALKVWMTLRVHGRRALAEAVEEAMVLADEAAARIRAEPTLEVRGAPAMSIVCFRARPPEGTPMEPEALDAWNREIQDRIVEEGTAMISSTLIEGRFALRFCILNHRTTRDDVSAVLDRIVELAKAGPP
jgi:aromatic-L-amino-acid decarboxylase